MRPEMVFGFNLVLNHYMILEFESKNSMKKLFGLGASFRKFASGDTLALRTVDYIDIIHRYRALASISVYHAIRFDWGFCSIRFWFDTHFNVEIWLLILKLFNALRITQQHVNGVLYFQLIWEFCGDACNFEKKNVNYVVISEWMTYFYVYYIPSFH